MSYNNIYIEVEDRLAALVIDRPKKLNALNQETIAELHQALVSLEQDEEIRAIVITGSGEKAFVAGADISEFADFDAIEGRELAANGQTKLFDFIEGMGTPVIAAVNGFALGGGLELAMSCHFRVASNRARMGLPEVSLGLIPGYGGTQRLPQLVGKGKAMEMITTGAMITAQEALSFGLVNHVVEADDLLEFCDGLAKKVTQNSPLAIRSAIRAINAGFSKDQDGYATEIELFGAAFETTDFEEGTTAFLEKRKPRF